MNPSDPSRSTASFGLVAWLEETRIALPLKGVECRYEVTGAIACVEIDQIFHQNADRALDCVFTFPLPAGAAVFRCEMHIDGRVVRARVQERGQAMQMFMQQKSAGRRAALVEMERENFFTLTLGNVQPQDVIVMRFAWFQELDRTGDELRLLIPTCPGIRYIPGRPLLRSNRGRGIVDDTDEVPDASRLTPPRIDALHPDAAYFAMEGRVAEADVREGTLSSPTHSLSLHKSDAFWSVEFGSKANVPDRDLVITWKEPEARQLTPQSWHWQDGDETYALLQLRAPCDVPAVTSFAQDFYFLTDLSGSMEGAKWLRTCEALRAFVDLLGPEDRIWITFFETSFRDLAEAPLTAVAIRNEPRFQRIETLGTRGGTELRPAAEHLLEAVARHSAGRHATALLITDGQIGNEPALLESFKRNPALVVHTFGIDTAVNDAFLKALARQQHGECWLRTPDDDIAGTVTQLGKRLSRPVITDLQVSGSWVPGRSPCPRLHAGEVCRVILRGRNTETVAIRGRLSDGREHRFSIGESAAGSEALKLLWAKERISGLLESGMSEEAVALAIEHNLICEGAAFVAWDEAENVAIAQDSLIQPVLRAVRRLEQLSSLYLDAICEEADSVGEIYLQRMAYRPIAPPDRREELSTRLLGAGLAPAMWEKWSAWASKSHRRSRGSGSRWDSIDRADSSIHKLRHLELSRAHREIAEVHIASVLDCEPAELDARVSIIGMLINSIVRLQEKFCRTLAPKAVVEGLLRWLLNSPPGDRRRIDQLSAFIKTLERTPFAGGMPVRAWHWRTFLESTLGAGVTASRATAAWLTEMAGLADHQWDRGDEPSSRATRWQRTYSRTHH